MDKQNDDERLLALAASIADGSSVDWDAVRTHADPDDAAILEQLRVVGEIAKVHGDAPTWGSLKIIEAIGHGSAGIVYRAFDSDLEREVALKITRAGHGSGSDLPAAVREARLLARVRHRNVVTVFGAEHRAGEIAVSMELVTGTTLDTCVRERGPFSAREAALIGSDVCRALAAVHAAGLIHGDVKAHNIMREEGGRIVLMDFSAGREAEPNREPQALDFAGTPLYVAPEVFQGRPRSRQSDIYSLGVTLFYLATGRYPIDGQTRAEIDRHHQRGGRPHRLRDLRPDLPEGFIQVVERAMAADPLGRYDSAGEMEAAISTALEHERPSRPYLSRTGGVAAGIFLTAMLAGTAYWAGVGRAAPPRSPVASSSAAVALPPATSIASAAGAAVGQYRVDAGLYRVESTGAVRLGAGAKLAAGDRLYLQVETSVPAHVYVVNEDDRGESYLLFPLPSQAALNPMPAGLSHHLPGKVGGEETFWEVSSIGGREHFLIFVSPEPMPVFARVFALLPPPSANRTMASASLPSEAVGILRAVGGLTSASQGLRDQFTTPLPEGPVSASGLWVRQISLENSGR